MTVERGALRPPNEAGSLLLRVVRNCPWNRCRFCPAYKKGRFSVRGVADVVADIRRLSLDPASHGCRTLFLQDGDVLAAPADDLVAILEAVRERLPGVGRVTGYARGETLHGLAGADLGRLRRAGLDRLHAGIESGCDVVLARMRKGTTHERQRAGCLKAKAAGLELCCYVMPGLGGRELTESHARETARLLRDVAPDHVRLRTAFVLEGTPLALDFQAGRFAPLDEVGTVDEIRRLIRGLSTTATYLASDHRLNLLLELEGRLPEESGRLLAIVDRFLGLAPDDQALFIAGRRLGLIRRMDDLDDAVIRSTVMARREQYRVRIPVPVDLLY